MPETLFDFVNNNKGFNLSEKKDTCRKTEQEEFQEIEKKVIYYKRNKQNIR